ncbi:MAG: hypothetical protein K8R41_09530 [Bacteroidales bacterium]|nr:hypothetical protein [Bacteroidales bacterium]
MKKRLITTIIVSILFLVSGVVLAQNKKNSIIVEVKITSPTEGENVPNRVPVEGIVEFSKYIEDGSYIVFVSVQDYEQTQYFASWKSEVQFSELCVVNENGKYIAEWKIGDNKDSAFIGDYDDDGKEFQIKAIVIKTMDIQLFKDKYFEYLPRREICIIDKSGFNKIITDFSGSAISDPVSVKRIISENR